MKRLTINDLPVHSTFLGHLSIPTSALLDLCFYFCMESPPIPPCLVNTPDNLHITTINLLAHGSSWECMRLNGPNGELRMGSAWCASSRYSERQFFESLGKFDLSKTQRLAVTVYYFPYTSKTSPISQTLLLMNNLRTLSLNGFDVSTSFICTLNPEQNESHTVVCPELEELVLYIGIRNKTYLRELMNMASAQAKRFSTACSPPTSTASLLQLKPSPGRHQPLQSLNSPKAPAIPSIYRSINGVLRAPLTLSRLSQLHQ